MEAETAAEVAGGVMNTNQALQKGPLMSIIQFWAISHNSPIAQFSCHDPAQRAARTFLL
jgi:hypothetical protein